MCLSRTTEELLPFIYYLARARRHRLRCEKADILKDPAFANYGSLSSDQLNGRLKEERARASATDDKTFRLTLSLSVGLTVLGSSAALVIGAATLPSVKIALAIIIGLALFYVMSAGFVAIGALRTLPSYGYGTQFLLQQQKGSTDVLAEALARQEIMNTIRHLRNETAFMAHSQWPISLVHRDADIRDEPRISILRFHASARPGSTG